MLRHYLPPPLRARFARTLDVKLFASNSEVLQATLDAANAIEPRNENRLVDGLLDSASAPRVVLGLAGTLDALAESRVHLLMVGGWQP